MSKIWPITKPSLSQVFKYLNPAGNALGVGEHAVISDYRRRGLTDGEQWGAHRPVRTEPGSTTCFHARLKELSALMTGPDRANYLQ